MSKLSTTVAGLAAAGKRVDSALVSQVAALEAKAEAGWASKHIVITAVLAFVAGAVIVWVL